MKILFHINSLGKGGAEHVVSVLADRLAADGKQVVIATEWTADEEYAVAESVKRITVGLTDADEKKSRVLKIYLRMKYLRKCIEREQPDIVISFMQKANYRAAWAMKGMNIPLLVSVRNDPKIDYAGMRNRIWNHMMTHRAAGCVFQTKEASEFFSKDFQEKSRILLNPMEDKFLHMELPEKRRSVIVTVGRITRQKNQLLLVKAFSSMLEQNISKQLPADLELHIYGADSGDGSLEELNDYIRVKNIEDKVRFMGTTTHLDQEIVDASLFVLPSDYEGMPNALIEAMAMGIPCIATDCPCGGPATLIQHEENGYLIPVGGLKELQEAMEYMLMHPEQAEKMGRKAMEIRTMVNATAVYAAWKQYIEEIIEKK
ncbi:MAG: glycosyltransferase [Lachnospiraceae bacterium]|nr:glycosyltransferase [Lachnospiraceae bacterium]